jgi:DNA polymerase-1
MERTIIHTAADLKQWFRTLNRQLVALDTETSSLKYFNLEAMGISICDGKQVCYVDLLDADNYEPLLRVLREEIPTLKSLIMHGAPFDMRVLHKLDIVHTEDVLCTMTAAFLVDENSPVGLKSLAVKYLGVPEDVAQSYSKAVTQGFKSDTFYRYAMNDAEWTFCLWNVLQQLLQAESLNDLFYNIEMPFQFVLRDLEINGILVDQGRLGIMRHDLSSTVLDLEKATYEAGSIEYQENRTLLNERELSSALNLGSPDQLSRFLQECQGIKLTQQSEQGHFSVDKFVLEQLALDNEFVRCLLKYRAAHKLLTMFVDKAPKFIDPDGRIRAHFNSCVARTGRLSSSEPNLQQLPRDNEEHGSIRSLFISPPGYTLVAADYAGQELRVLAEVSRDLTMIEAFILDQDLHLTMANKFFGLGIPQPLLFTSHPKYEEARKKYKAYRDKSKTINFGIAYGKTAVGFAHDWNISLQEAEQVVEQYFEAAPRVKEAIDATSAFLDQRGYVATLAGRRRRLAKGVKRSYRQAFNMLIQGFCADLVKAAAGKVHKLTQAHPEWDCRIVLTVHDELVYEMKTDYVTEAMPLIKDTMEHAWPPLAVPMCVDIGCGQTYEEAK